MVPGRTRQNWLHFTNKFVYENQLSRWNDTGFIEEDENVKFMLLSSAAAQTPCTTPTDLVSAGQGLEVNRVIIGIMEKKWKLLLPRQKNTKR